MYDFENLKVNLYVLRKVHIHLKYEFISHKYQPNLL